MPHITFSQTDRAFFNSVRNSVDSYFAENKIRKTGDWRLYIKAILFIPAAALIYLYLLLFPYGLLTGLLLTAVLGLVLTSIAFNVMHDACHGSYAENNSINKLMSLTMNCLGSSAFLWRIRHNILHHTYTNIDGKDHDIANWPLLRQSHTQPRKSVHRYQHLYMFVLYAVSTLAWVFVQDFEKFILKKISPSTGIAINGREQTIFWISKLLFLMVYVILPIWLLSWQAWAVGFILIHIIMGLSLTIVFQLAHLVEKTSFQKAGDEPLVIESGWAVHEIMTTANFSNRNKIISWWIGGLNFQIEHHLFPAICHIHYPAISIIVKQHCEQFNLPYHHYASLRHALISHVRFMMKLGRTD